MHKRAIAQALKVSDPNVEQKICKAGTKDSSANVGGNCNGNKSSSMGSWTTPDKGLVSALAGKGEGKWPNINGNGTAGGTADATVTVAGDIISMTKDEKAIVAGHLAKTVEGGEVVEIRSVLHIL